MPTVCPCVLCGKSDDDERMMNFLALLAVSLACLVSDTCTAARSVARALFGSLRLDSAASEGGAVSDLFAFLLRRRGARGVWAIAA